MQEHQDQIDSTNAICPYCEHKYQPESETFSEDEREETCDNCGKKYYLSQSITVDHETSPDCELNGEQHDFQPGKYHPGMSICRVCGATKFS